MCDMKDNVAKIIVSLSVSSGIFQKEVKSKVVLMYFVSRVGR